MFSWLPSTSSSSTTPPPSTATTAPTITTNDQQQAPAPAATSTETKQPSSGYFSSMFTRTTSGTTASTTTTTVKEKPVLTTTKTPCGKCDKPILIGLSDSAIAIKFTTPLPIPKEIPKDARIGNYTSNLISVDDESIELSVFMKSWQCAVCDYMNEDRALLKCELCSTARPLPLSVLSRLEALSLISRKDSKLSQQGVSNDDDAGALKPEHYEFEVQVTDHNASRYGGTMITELIQGGAMEITDDGPFALYTVKNLNPDSKYDIRVRARVVSNNPKIVNDWSPHSDVLTALTLETDNQQRLENIARVLQFLEHPDNFEPYPEDDAIPDSISAKAARGLEGLLSVVSWTGIAKTYIALAKNAYKLHKSGIASLIFREELQQLVVALSSFVGEAAGGLGLTSKDIIIGTYYLTWEYKRQRLLRPNGEFLDHKKPNPGVLEEDAPEAMIRELCWFLPLASMSYRSSPAQIQWVLDTFPSREIAVSREKHAKQASNVTAVSIARMARRTSVLASTKRPAGLTLNGNSAPIAITDKTVAAATPSPLQSVDFAPPFRLIAARCNSKKLRPAFFVTANPKTKLAIIAIRGTYDFEDVLTDSLCDVATAKFRFHEGASDGKEIGPEFRVHAGFLRSAQWMLRGDNKLEHVADASGQVQNGQTVSGAGIMHIVRMLKEKKYKINITGHSLGAGVAVLSALLIADEFPDIQLRVIGYGMPACVDERLADACKGPVNQKYCATTTVLPDLARRVSVISLIFRDDIVPRLSLTNARKFAMELKETSPRWDPLVRQDLASFTERVKTVWAPSQRAHALNIYQQDGSRPKTPPGEDKAAASSSATNSVLSEAIQKIDPKMQAALDNPLVPPGMIAHVYLYRSTHHATLVDFRFEPLRRIEPHFNVVDDHRLTGILTCVRNVVAVREAEAKGYFGPNWESLADHAQHASASGTKENIVMSQRIECAVCRYFVGWDITGTEESSEVRGSHHCYSCGLIVCEKCSSNAISLPSIGVLHPVRVCDDCRYKLTVCAPLNYTQDITSSMGLNLGDYKSSFSS